MSSKTPNIPLPNPASHSSTMPPSSDALPLTLPDTTQKSQPGMADAAAEADTPTICGLSTPPTSPPIHSLGSSRSKPCAVQAPPAAEGQLQPHAAMPLPPIGPDRRQRYATHDHPILTSTYTSSSSTSSSSSGSVDRAVRALMAELDASIFRNVSSAVSAYFLDINDVGHFVSMPHIGACASPEANHVMRLIEETLTRNAGYLLDPTDRAGLEAFGDALARRVSLDPRVLTSLAKVLIVLRLGHTATAARQGHHPAVAAMVPEFPLFLDAHVQIQARKVGGSTFAAVGSTRTPTSPDDSSSAQTCLGMIAEDSSIPVTQHHAGLHRSVSLHTSPSAAAHAHFASPPESPAATALTFSAAAVAASASRPFTAPMSALALAPTMRASPAVPATRQRTVSMPAPSPHAQAAAAAAVAWARPKTEVAVVIESMIADTRSTTGGGGMMRHPVYLLHVQDAAAAAAATGTSACGFGLGLGTPASAPVAGASAFTP